MATDPSSPFAWTNPSIRGLAGDRDPVSLVSEMVSDLLLAAADAGAIATPINPFELASLMGIGLRPHFDVSDARLVSSRHPASALEATQPSASAPLARFVTSEAPLVIEYNPTRPRGRLRYSVAHELAHALFPDASEETRNRTHTGAVRELAEDDSWQLELVCNVAAAELLMPSEAIEGLVNSRTDINFLMAQRAKFNVSTEALLRRLVHATGRPLALAAFSRLRDTAESDLRCEYVLGSRAWVGSLARGAVVPSNSILASPIAVGQTAQGELSGLAGTDLSAQVVGIPPYPNRRLPRILSLLEPHSAELESDRAIHYVTSDLGEAFGLGQPGEGGPIVAHAVSDSAHAWGRYGVAGTLQRLVPDAGRAFRAWSVASPDNLQLGHVHIVEVPMASGAMVTIASMVVQQGYGPSTKPRLSYVALADALRVVAAHAQRVGTDIHMPGSERGKEVVAGTSSKPRSSGKSWSREWQ